jgi:hypothetical protein
LRRLVLQPGAAACGAASFVLVIRVAHYLAVRSAYREGAFWPIFSGKDHVLGDELCSWVFPWGLYLCTITAVWGLLGLSRRWRAEPSWIDRAGRSIGILWIVLELCNLVGDVVRNWGL